MKWIKYILFAISFFPVTVMGQDLSYPNFVHKDQGSFSGYVIVELLAKLMDKHVNELQKLCVKTNGTIQVTLDGTGHLLNVKITGDSSLVLNAVLKNIAMGTEGMWQLQRSSAATEVPPIVLPYFIHISDGCEQLHNDPYYLNVRSYRVHYLLNSDSLKNVTINKLYHSPLQCYLLDPLYFVHDYGYQDLNPKKR